jgi:DNA-binding response OmpR family regulator
MCAARILIVEDEAVALEMLSRTLRDQGYDTLVANNGDEAWRLLSQEPDSFDVVILDRMTADMGGIDTLRRIKTEPDMAHLPVIMLTSMAADEAIAEGLQAGAHYYLTKPFAADTLVAIVAAAVRDHEDYLDLQQRVLQATRTLGRLAQAEFSFRSPEEARDIATMLAQVSPDPGRVVLGLSELMLNAVLHGNLGIGYKELSQIGVGAPLITEIERRLTLPEYADKRAKIEFRRTADELHFIIRDEGQGFDWRQYLEMNPERAFDTHGRGIAISKLLSFDRLTYHGCGNEVEAVVSLSRIPIY